jgi:histidinol-phosphatase (PHP family)
MKQTIKAARKRALIDAHVHLERGPYTSAWVDQFIQTAAARGICELYLLEHSHRFVEFRPMYDEIMKPAPYAAYQTEWLLKRNVLSLADYHTFTRTYDRSQSPVTIHFGLEICYFRGTETLVSKILKKYAFDFITGSVHWIDGWGFDHPHTQEEWKNRDVDLVYGQYYAQMNDLISSGLFTHLAHPDSIKCFNYLPRVSLTKTYRTLAKNLKARGMKVENSAGLYINYGHAELGMNAALFNAFTHEGCEIITASDAHRPEDAGLHIETLTRQNPSSAEFVQ